MLVIYRCHAFHLLMLCLSIIAKLAQTSESCSPIYSYIIRVCWERNVSESIRNKFIFILARNNRSKSADKKAAGRNKFGSMPGLVDNKFLQNSVRRVWIIFGALNEAKFWTAAQ